MMKKLLLLLLGFGLMMGVGSATNFVNYAMGTHNTSADENMMH